MRRSHPRSFRSQATFLRRQFLQDGGLPFTDVLTEGVITEAPAAVGVWPDRIYTPLVTLWVFLGQVLSADHSCRNAVARLIAQRVAPGQKPCSARTGAYCRARQRLPEGFFSAVARRVGRNLDARIDRRWLWTGRRVCLFDGSTVSMPDTPETGTLNRQSWSACHFRCGVSRVPHTAPRSQAFSPCPPRSRVATWMRGKRRPRPGDLV